MVKFDFGMASMKLKKKVSENLEEEYGEFVTSMICDAASITIPSLRFCNSSYLQIVSSTTPIISKDYSFFDVNTIKDNTLYKFLAANRFLQQKSINYPGIDRINKLASELSGTGVHFDLLSSLRKLYEVRSTIDTICPGIMDTVNFFDSSQALYQFLDKPNRVLFLDSVINQMSYPMHYVSNKAIRFSYIAKAKRMFTDLLLFDECRYVYDWIPAIHQIPMAFTNPSWQYTFRFGLDGLIKQRLNYNNEFFFQGSVVSKTTPGFEAQNFPKRIKLN